MGNCLRSSTLFDENQQELFEACRDADFERAQQAIEAGADINFKYQEHRQTVYSYPLGPKLPCISEISYPGTVWYAGKFVSKKWLWRTYAVHAVGTEWEAPTDVRPAPETEDGDTLLFIALKCNRRDLADWILLTRPELDLSTSNCKNRDVRAVARLYHKEHLLNRRPEIMTPELAKPMAEQRRREADAAETEAVARRQAEEEERQQLLMQQQQQQQQQHLHEQEQDEQAQLEAAAAAELEDATMTAATVASVDGDGDGGCDGYDAAGDGGDKTAAAAVMEVAAAEARGPELAEPMGEADAGAGA